MVDARAARRVVAFAAISAVVHAIGISVGRIDLPRAPEELPPLAVRIETARVAPPSAARVAKPHISHAAFADPVLVASAPAASSSLPVEPALVEVVAADAPSAEPEAQPPAPEPAQVASADQTPVRPELPPLPDFPRKGRITYDLVYGRDKFPVGRTVQTWQTDGQRYQLASRSETTGIVDLFRSQHRTYLSRGILTRDGFKPDTFIMSRNRGRGAEEARAQFDWDSGSVTLGPAAGQRAQALPPHSQDLVSFMYQMSLTPPPPGRVQLPVTNGSKLETYVLDVLAEETIETPLGALRTLPIRHVRTAGNESADLWLAVEYRYLPVRIRFYGRDGEPAGEQIVTEIRLGD